MREKIRGENGKRMWERVDLPGSYTVEASLVMSLSLLFIAICLTGIFEIHGRVVGNFVLQEGLERMICLEDEKSPQELEAEERKRLRSYFWCQNGTLSLEEDGEKIRGKVNAASENEITVKKFDPEAFLRVLRALGV